MLVKQKYISPLECSLWAYTYTCVYGKQYEELYSKGVQVRKEECRQYKELEAQRKIIYSKRRINKWQ